MNHFVQFLFGWFKYDQLLVLGLTELQIDFILALVLVVLIYFTIKPIVKLLMRLNWAHFSAYIITVLLFSHFISYYRINQIKSGAELRLLSDNLSLLLAVFSLGIAISLLILIERVIIYLKLTKKQSS